MNQKHRLNSKGEPYHVSEESGEPLDFDMPGALACILDDYADACGAATDPSAVLAAVRTAIREIYYIFGQTPPASLAERPP